MRLLELFGTLAHTFPIILLIKFLFPYQLQVKLNGMPEPNLQDLYWR
jgi:hypothetical protein